MNHGRQISPRNLCQIVEISLWMSSNIQISGKFRSPGVQLDAELTHTWRRVSATPDEATYRNSRCYQLRALCSWQII